MYSTHKCRGVCRYIICVQDVPLLLAYKMTLKIYPIEIRDLNESLQISTARHH